MQVYKNFSKRSKFLRNATKTCIDFATCENILKIGEGDLGIHTFILRLIFDRSLISEFRDLTHFEFLLFEISTS